MTSPLETSRDLRVDFLRGIALLVIFSDHIPSNVVAQYTPIAFGFSDMAEVFVFLSGYTCGISYGRRIREQGFSSCLQRAWIRAAQVFGAKLFVTILALLLLIVLERWVVAVFIGTRWNITLVKRHPILTILELEAFRLELFQFCVLSLYIVLLIVLPLMVWALTKKLGWTLLASALLYLGTQFYPGIVALAEPWRGAMLFNPFAWQFLFYGATALALLKPETRARLRPHGLVALTAVAILVFASIIHEKHPEIGIPWTGKSNLEWIRLLHFVAVVAVGWRITPASSTLSCCPLCLPIMICGRFSLVGYCTAGLFGILGTAALSADSRGWVMQALVNIFGWAGCLGATAIWSTAFGKNRRGTS